MVLTRTRCCALGSQVRKWMTPLSAELPYKLEDAPFKTSTCCTASMGMAFQSTPPASGLSAGKSSTRMRTRDPAPKLQPLPERMFACPSCKVTPGDI